MSKKPFMELGFSDSFMFAATMEDREICRYIKRDRGMEVQYMLFSEMLHDEHKAGEQKGQDRVLRLMNLMEADGNADKIPKLWKDSDFLREMYSKYHIEA